MMNFLDVAPLPGGGLYGEGGSLLALLLALGCLIVIAGACAGLVLLLRARSKNSARRKEGPPACDQDATAPSEALTPAQDEIAPPAQDERRRADTRTPAQDERTCASSQTPARDGEIRTADEAAKSEGENGAADEATKAEGETER